MPTIQESLLRGILINCEKVDGKLVVVEKSWRRSQTPPNGIEQCQKHRKGSRQNLTRETGKKRVPKSEELRDLWEKPPEVPDRNPNAKEARVKQGRAAEQGQPKTWVSSSLLQVKRLQGCCAKLGDVLFPEMADATFMWTGAASLLSRDQCGSSCRKCC